MFVLGKDLISGTKASSIRLKSRNSDYLWRCLPMKSHLPSKVSVVIAALSLLLSACGPSASIAKSDLQRVTAPDTPPGDIQALVNNNNAFAFDLYRSLQTQDGNLIYSPYSISLVLAMTYAGA